MALQNESERRTVSRRKFLTGVGAGTAGALAAGPACVMAGPAAAAHAAAAIPADRFGRIFPSLPPFLTEVDQRRHDALLDIGRAGGMLDARDNLAAGPILLITDPALSANNQDNPTMTAGVTFLG